MVGSGRIVIEYDDKYPHAIVKVAGQFTHWEHVDLGLLSGTKYAAVFDGVEPGQVYAYKFIIDGHWTLLDGLPTEDDGNGNTNHIIVAETAPEESPSGLAQATPSSSVSQEFNSAKDVSSTPSPVVPTGNADPNASFGASNHVYSALAGNGNTSEALIPEPDVKPTQTRSTDTSAYADATSAASPTSPGSGHVNPEAVLDPSRVKSGSSSDLFTEAHSDHYSEVGDGIPDPEYPVSPRPTAVDSSASAPPLPAIIGSPLESQPPASTPPPPATTERVPIDISPKKDHVPIDINTGFPSNPGEKETLPSTNTPTSRPTGGPTLRSNSKRSSLPPVSPPPVNSSESRNAAVIAAAARAPGAAKQEFASLGPQTGSPKTANARTAAGSPEARNLAKEYAQAGEAVRREQQQQISQDEAVAQQNSSIWPKAEAQAATDIRLSTANEGKGRVRRFFKKLIN